MILSSDEVSCDWGGPLLNVTGVFRRRQETGMQGEWLVMTETETGTSRRGTPRAAGCRRKLGQAGKASTQSPGGSLAPAALPDSRIVDSAFPLL